MLPPVPHGQDCGQSTYKGAQDSVCERDKCGRVCERACERVRESVRACVRERVRECVRA